MAPDTRAQRETRHNATAPASSAGSHDTIGHTTASFGPPQEDTIASAHDDITRMSYISPANVGFDPTASVAPYERPMAPTPGFDYSPSPVIAPAPVKADHHIPGLLITDLLPSSHAPSSCDFGTPKNFAHTPVFGPSPPFVPKTRGRAAFQARCETASPSESSLSRFLRGFSTSSASTRPSLQPVVRTSTPESCDGDAAAVARASAPNRPITNEPISGLLPIDTHDPTANEQANAFTAWSLYAVPGNLLADFVSGVLRFSQLDQDGNPVFVKDTDTDASSQQQAADAHKHVNAVHISQEETRIFVSMDQLRQEIAGLQEHDEAMEREADKAHQEKARLELQLQEARGTCRKASSDSAIGSDSDDDIRKRAQTEKLKRMQKRLDEANILANSQHVHIDSLTAERDELIKECRLAHAHKKVLDDQSQALREQTLGLHKENQAMKAQIQQAGNYFISIESEMKQLISENERLRQQLRQKDQQNDSLRKTRKSHSDQIKNLQTELEATRAQLGDTIRDTNVLISKDRENDALSAEVEQLKAELEVTCGQLGGIIDDNRVLRNKNRENDARSEQIEKLKAELEATRSQLGDTTRDIQVLVHKNKEIKAQRDKVEGLYESLQHDYTVIHRKLREESTVNSVSSTRSEARSRPLPAIQIKRSAAPTKRTTAPTKRAAAPAATTTAASTNKAPTVRASGGALDENDLTIRPAYEPIENLKILIGTTESEVASMQRSLDRKIEESKGLLRGYSNREFERLHKEKMALEKAIHQKTKIIYHQYDLLEFMEKNGSL
ncbi:hypothetical protein KVR01_006759 [Diaporthe batatas]|uniref:uncharacterized protein n=1 Tax=Diaporthe batatas TaxID=748121 RepID=UPI001D0397E3|nr:uncharacterized protein KVR01_006759 [Diaporthe batatas]KAG8163462.1 hypothetical protein KVR01_006759 [Diaporthe batatas]